MPGDDPARRRVEEALEELQRRYGSKVLASPQLLRAALADLVPGDRAAIDAVMADQAQTSPRGAAAIGVPEEARNRVPSGEDRAHAEAAARSQQRPTSAPPAPETRPGQRRGKHARSLPLVMAGTLAAVGLTAAILVAAAHQQEPLTETGTPASDSPLPSDSPSMSDTPSPSGAATRTAPATDPRTASGALHAAFPVTASPDWSCDPADHSAAPGSRLQVYCTLHGHPAVSAWFILWRNTSAERGHLSGTRSFEEHLGHPVTTTRWSVDGVTSGTMLRYQPAPGIANLEGYYTRAPYSFTLQASTPQQALRIFQSDRFPLRVPRAMPPPPA